jgi:hypothetical protein
MAMKKLLLIAFFSLMLLGVPNAHARNSAASYDSKFWSQQEFVQVYNSSTASIYRDYVVGLDTAVTGAAQAVNPNIGLGQYVTAVTSATTDNIYVMGVADETIPAGQLGRICIRGPHKVVALPTIATQGAFPSTIGSVLSQCKSNVASYSVAGTTASVISGGFACPYSTAAGTAAGGLGYILNATATTDTGDVGQATNPQSFTTGTEYWVWIDPHVIR